jgi:hypothetical protein
VCSKKKLIENGYSRALWLICKQLHVLPSDPNFLNLTYNQIQWLKENIIYDYKIESEAYKKIKSGNKSEESIEVESDGYSNDDLITMMQEQRKPKSR